MEKFRGIVLKSKSVGEANVAITLLTAEEGQINITAKSVKKANAKLKFAVQPFCFGEFEVTKGKGGYILTGCDCYELFYELRGNLEKYYLANALVEIMLNSTKEGMVCGFELKYLVESLTIIVNTKKNIDYIAIKLLFNALDVCGYKIDNFNCGNCGEILDKDCYFCFNSCEFYCENCKKDYVRVDRETMLLIKNCVQYDTNQLENMLYDKISAIESLRFIYKLIYYKLYFKNNSLSQFAKLVKGI